MKQTILDILAAIALGVAAAAVLFFGTTSCPEKTTKLLTYSSIKEILE